MRNCARESATSCRLIDGADRVAIVKVRHPARIRDKIVYE